MAAGVVRCLQLVVALFFTFATALWFGGITMLVFSLWVNITAGLGGSILSTLFAALIVAGLVYFVIRVPHVARTIVDIGVGVGKLGLANLRRLDHIALSLRKGQPPSTDHVNVSYKSDATGG